MEVGEGQNADPLGIRSHIVDINTLEQWSESSEVPDYEELVVQDSRWLGPPFKYDQLLNNKVILWSGDITRLNSTAIVSSTNESMTDKNLITEKIFKLAGPELKQEITTLRVCKTGESRLTKGYDLPARFIIHTVGPRYNVKYKTAAESALYNCYRSVMQIVREKSLSSIAFCPINSVKRGYPPEEGAHIAIRTVRRFLEKFGETIDKVILALSEVDEDAYIKLLPLYFPRSEREALYSMQHLPDDIGNEFGEPVIADRQIRISDKPTVFAHSKLGGEDFDTSVNINDEFATSVLVGKHSFAKMEGDLDNTRRQVVLHGRTTQEQTKIETQRRYERWLRRARQTDLSQIAALKCLYQSGVDKMGRQVVIFVGKNFPGKEIDLEKALMYFIHVMDPIVGRDYVVVYLHTLAGRDNQPQMAFLKQVFNLVDHKFKTNLRAFYTLHPTFWARVMTWFFTTFTASTIKDKIHHLFGMEYLYKYISQNELDLPSFVHEYDLQKNGKNYYNCMETDSSEITGDL